MNPASTTTFSQAAWQGNLALYHDTLALPFNQELAAGTLSVERFHHYIIQDAHYLVVQSFGRVSRTKTEKGPAGIRVFVLKV